MFVSANQPKLSPIINGQVQAGAIELIANSAGNLVNNRDLTYSIHHDPEIDKFLRSHQSGFLNSYSPVANVFSPFRMGLAAMPGEKVGNVSHPEVNFPVEMRVPEQDKSVSFRFKDDSNVKTEFVLGSIAQALTAGGVVPALKQSIAGVELPFVSAYMSSVQSSAERSFESFPIAHIYLGRDNNNTSVDIEIKAKQDDQQRANTVRELMAAGVADLFWGYNKSNNRTTELSVISDTLDLGAHLVVQIHGDIIHIAVVSAMTNSNDENLMTNDIWSPPVIKLNDEIIAPVSVNTLGSVNTRSAALLFESVSELDLQAERQRVVVTVQDKEEFCSFYLNQTINVDRVDGHIGRG
ncbi:hypothetical protein BVY03_01150 [bacterium K02(2017)]|nr:hypothetical protein BVY03_01150 [bacterium K02(2017)]